MSRIIWFPASIISFCVFFAGETFAQPVNSIPPKEFYNDAMKIQAKARTVSYDDAMSWTAKGDAVLVDLRSPDQYKQSHLKGAVNLPMTDVTDEQIKKIAGDTSRKIILYCDYNLFPTRRIALTTFGYPAIYKLGYENLYTLEELWHGPKRQYEFEGSDKQKPLVEFLGH